jgi:hypothetical protein
LRSTEPPLLPPYITDTNDIASLILGSDRVLMELQLTYSFFFSRHSKSRQLAKQLFAQDKIAIEFVRRTDTSIHDTVQLSTETEWPKVYFGQWDTYNDNQPDLGDLPFFGPRLLHLQEQMRLWRPRTIRELFIQGYGDRLIWFSVMFGVIIGIIGILSLVFSVVQTVLTLKSYYASVEALNVALEQLRLQQAQLQ